MYIKKDNYTMKIFILHNIFKRFKGFMFKKDIDYALCFPKCNSIHTFFMKESIDVYMTDKNNKILYVYSNLGKNKIIFPKRHVDKVFELPVGKIKFQIGEQIKIED